MREWFVIEKTAGKGVFASEETRLWKGYIPRDVAEAICGRIGMVMVYHLIGMIRRYFIRRLFNWWDHR